jgi:hypothetical protein
MTVSAYVLIQTDVGQASVVADAVQTIDGVTAADGVTGPYDVIARAEADGVDELGHLVVGRDPSHRRGHPNAHVPNRQPVTVRSESSVRSLEEHSTS